MLLVENTGTATRTVTVVDTTAPVITTSSLLSSIEEGDINLEVLVQMKQ
jgi:hypothetical protein